LGFEPLASELKRAGDIGGVGVFFWIALGQHQLGLIGALDLIQRVEPYFAGGCDYASPLRRSHHAITQSEIYRHDDLAKGDPVLVRVCVLQAHTLIPAAWHCATVTKPAVMHSPAWLALMVRAHGLRA
jgi:hypothetical protein